MSQKVVGLIVMVFGILLAGFLAATCFGVIIVRWRAPEYTGYEGNIFFALAAAAGVLVGVAIYKLGVRIADRVSN